MGGNKKFRPTVNTRSLAAPLQLRLYQDQRAYFEDAAASTGETVSVYLRRFVDGGLEQNEILEHFLESVSAIEKRLDQLEERLDSGASKEEGALYETLALLRILMRNNGGSNSIDMIQSSLKNMGHEIFSFPSHK
ncbi:hypothetical protein [Halomonas colorata]|uniref:Uncharacterized protein n=1 Tax=Halomonas colorata TaxID=2742615 RepID=A0ABR9G3T1_9GAMM|nr:hypothetical protein [Halomonas colorata]MBE0465564.1 hypothetical protein [Halomonas colorata]